jgi:hypothetical protein
MATINWLRLDSALLRESNTWFRKAITSFFNPDSHKLLLLNGSFSRTSTWEAILAGELIETNGYNRLTISFNEPTITNHVVTLESPYYNITASGLSLQFNCLCLVANGHANGNKPVVSMTASSDYVNIISHGLTLNDKVMFTGDGIISTGINKDTIYYVRDVSGDNFKLAATEGGSAIDLTTDSNGELFCRYANGWPEIIGNISPTKTILNGSTSSFNVVWQKT